MNDNIDVFLKGIMKENISISEKANNSIQEAFKMLKNKKDFSKHAIQYSKKVAIIICCLIGLSGVVFASGLIIFLSDIFNSNHHGIEQALNNQYVENITMDYIESNGIQFKFNYFLMDSSNMNFIISMKTSKENIIAIDMEDIEIKDNNNMILHSSSSKEYENKIISTISFCDYIEPVDNGIINFSVNLRAISSEFPKSEKIYFNFTTLKIYYMDKVPEEITGNWNIVLDVPKKFIERNDIEYICNDSEKISLEYAKLTNSGFIVKMKLKNLNDITFDYSTIANSIIAIDTQGNEYKMRDTISISKDGLIETTFPLCIYDTNSNITIKFKYLEGEDFQIVNLTPKS